MAALDTLTNQQLLTQLEREASNLRVRFGPQDTQDRITLLRELVTECEARWVTPENETTDAQIDTGIFDTSPERN